MAFIDDLKTFSNDLLEIIKSYQSDNPNLFTPSMSVTAEKEIKNFVSKSVKAIVSYNNTSEKNIKLFDEFLETHKAKRDQLHINYENEIKELNLETIGKIKELTDTNSSINSELRKKTTEIELEVSWNKNKNDNNIKLFQTEYENSIARFDYQLDNSKVAYNETVNYFNSDLKTQLDAENSKYKVELSEYNDGTENIRKRYENNIQSESDALNQYIDKYNNIQAAQKEKRYIETVDLNARIRSLVNEKNQKIVAERIDYSKDQNVNKIEHDMKKRESLLSAQQTSKEFVLNMDKLNSQMINMRDSYQTSKSKIEKELQYELLLKHKEEESDVKNYINDTSKEASKKIKKIQKRFDALKKLERNKTKSELSKIEKEYKRKLANNNLDKNILDVNRNYDLKINNEKENADNKYFQALNNIDENDFDFKTKIHNNNYNISANIIKLENALKTIAIDSKDEKENINHQIEIQKLSNILKKTNVELDTLINIQKKMTEYESLRHNKCIKFLTINNLLEIEKCKTLAEFNNRNYNQNVENAKKILELSKRNIHMQNSKFSSLAELQIEKNNVLAEKKILENNNKINLISLKQDKKIEVIERKLLYDTESLINKLLKDRFSCELNTISKLVTTFIALIKELEHSATFLVDCFFDNIVFRPEYVTLVRDIMTSVFGVIYDYYDDLVESFYNYLNELIENRFAFEKDFKYKSNYEELMVEYNAIFEELYDKKDRLESELTELSIEIDLKNQTIFALKNQINMVRSPYNKSNFGHGIKKSISELRKQQKYNESELIRLINEQNETNRKLTDLVTEISHVREENEKKENEINLIQYNGSISYYNMKKEFIACVSTIRSASKSKLFTISDGDIDVTTYENQLTNKRIELLNFNRNLFNKLYGIMNRFSFNSISNFEKTDKITDTKYEEDIAKLNEKAENEYSVINEKIEEDNRTHDNSVVEINKRISNTNHYYYLMEKNFTNEQSYTSKNSLLLKEKLEQLFYSELYAIRDNQAMIVKDYEETIAKYSEESISIQDELVHKLNETKTNLDEELKKFIRQKHEYVKELPEKIKEKEINLTKDTKEINKNIQKQKIQDRQEYFSSRSKYFKNLAELQANYNVKLKTYNSERKHKIRDLKRRNFIELRKI